MPLLYETNRLSEKNKRINETDQQICMDDTEALSDHVADNVTAKKCGNLSLQIELPTRPVRTSSKGWRMTYLTNPVQPSDVTRYP
jgi:hypothetical protein